MGIIWHQFIAPNSDNLYLDRVTPTAQLYRTKTVFAKFGSLAVLAT